VRRDTGCPRQSLLLKIIGFAFVAFSLILLLKVIGFTFNALSLILLLKIIGFAFNTLRVIRWWAVPRVMINVHHEQSNNERHQANNRNNDAWR
jgi:hypothetical protein